MVTDNLDGQPMKGVRFEGAPMGYVFIPIRASKQQRNETILLTALAAPRENGGGPRTFKELAEFTRMPENALRDTIELAGDKIAYDADSGLYLLSVRTQVENSLRQRRSGQAAKLES